ncbi:MAG: hypothetical protein ACK4OK_07960, partial [Thermoflexus sp.]
MAGLFAELGAVAQGRTRTPIPPPVARAMAEVLGFRVPAETLATPAGLAAALDNAGTRLEARLAALPPGMPLPPDLKASLQRLQAALAGWTAELDPAETPALPKPAGHERPPLRGALPHGQAEAPKVFIGLEEVELAYNLGKVTLHTPIRVYTETVYDENGQRYPDGRPRRRLIETTVGRALFNLSLPEGLRFVNDTMDKGRLKDLVAQCFQWLGPEATVEMVDRLKEIGFRYATRSGITIAVADLPIPPVKREVLARYEALVAEVERQYRRGLLTEEERYNRVIDLWQRATNEIAEAVKQTMSADNNVAIMALSGATKGGFQPVAQLAGMRGLMADPTGRIIELPIRSNFREGLTTIEYFISTHGARKGLADTALRTADAGYLTRRLVDVAQDVIINAYDCGTRSGIWIRASDDVGGQTLRERIFGRVLAAPVFDPRTGALIADELHRHGHDVAVVEQRDVGWGSTSASTALLQYEIDTHLVDLA